MIKRFKYYFNKFKYLHLINNAEKQAEPFDVAFLLSPIKTKRKKQQLHNGDGEFCK